MRRAAPLLLLGALACGSERPRAFAGQVTSKSQLIGGPRALGEIGDYRLSNSRVRFIVQSIDSARAFGTFGGSLIDADLARPEEQADPRTGLNGQDGLGELFATFFLSSARPEKIEVIDDGHSGHHARVRVTGSPTDFFTSTHLLDQAALGPGLKFAVDYALGPEDDFLVITASVLNTTADELGFPVFIVPIPVGFIALFGEGQPLFIPGEAGYDARFTLQRAYGRSYRLPALPGLTPRVVAIDAHRVSYGLMFCTTCKSPLPTGLPGVQGYVWNHRDVFSAYADIQPESVHVPFVSGSLFGLFVGELPEKLPAGAAHSTSLELHVGAPGVSTQTDALYGEQGDDTGAVSGVVREEVTLQPVPDATVVFFAGTDSKGDAVTSARSDPEGRFRAQLPPGKYAAIARKAPHPNAAPVQISVAYNRTTYFEPILPRTAILAVEVTDETGRRIPAKVSLDAPYSFARADQDPKTFLYDLRLGDPYRATDIVPDTADPETRRYLEGVLRVPLGRGSLEVRPGAYRLTASRGPAYAIATREVTLLAGVETQASFVLQRLLPSRGRVAADLHVHAIGSIDSDVLLADRATGYAAEGVDFIALTEHNALLDIRPTLERLQLTEFVQSTVGSEVSSLEAGHWNAYPLQYLPGPAAHGAVDWPRRPPQAIFDDLRASGPDGGVVVQANHPRDATLGYFTAYGVTGDALTGEASHDWPGQVGITAPSGPEFGAGRVSLDFDAIEVLTGKRVDRLRTLRVPQVLPPPPRPPTCDVAPSLPCLGPPGTIVRDSDNLVAYPGSLEDWEHLLDRGVRVTAVGNSDSHSLLDEPGYPRNLVELGHEWTFASEVGEDEVAAAIKAGRNQLTNGPEITLVALDPLQRGPDGEPLEVPVGDLLRSDSSGQLDVHVIVDAAPWIDVQRASILVGRGRPCDESMSDCHEVPLPLDPTKVPAGAVRRLDVVAHVPIPVGQDAWVSARADGDKSLWPVSIPLEVPPLLVADAIAAVAGAVGYTNPLGNMVPTQRTIVRPFALTNPIYIDGDGDGRFGPLIDRRGPTSDPPSGPPTPGARAKGDDGALLDLRRALRRW
jgi:hypothetical protein